MPRSLGSPLSCTRSRKRALVAIGLAVCLGSGVGCAAVAHLEPGPVHIVRTGDTLAWIAGAYGVPVERVARANGLSDADHILVGQQIRLPRGARLVYRAGPGETSRQIAARHAVPVEPVARRNRISDPDRVITGLHIVLPREARLLPPPWRRKPPDVAARRPEPAGEALVVRAETLYREARFEEALATARRARSHFAALGTRPDLQARAAFIEGCSLVAFGQSDAAGAVFAGARIVAPDYEPPRAWLSPRIDSLWKD